MSIFQEGIETNNMGSYKHEPNFALNLRIVLLIKTQEFIIWFNSYSLFKLYEISSTIIMNTPLQEVPSNAQSFLTSQHISMRKRLIYDYSICEAYQTIYVLHGSSHI